MAKTFPKGLRFFEADGAPDFVIGTLVISLNELVQFCKDNPDLLTEYKGVKQLKCSILKSKEGKPYIVVDEYKKGKNNSENLPF